MYIILVYDVGQKRVGKVCKYLRTMLHWIQNSVFEGDLTEAQLDRMRQRLCRLIDEEEDAVLIYRVSSSKWVEREAIGIEKNPRTNLL